MPTINISFGDIKMYSLLLALIYIAFISLGLPDSLLGSGWPVIHTDLDVPISFMGIISMTISGGTIVSSLLSDKLTGKLGTRIVTVISVFLTAFALFGFSFSTQFWMLIVFAVPYGLGAGAIDAALNNYVALHYSSKHMSWLHCFWGVGTIVSPFVMSYALTRTYAHVYQYHDEHGYIDGSGRRNKNLRDGRRNVGRLFGQNRFTERLPRLGRKIG